MANIVESSTWESGVYQLETDDPVLGGAPAFDAGLPVTGHANAQAQQLANRTKYLKDQHEALVSEVSGKVNISDINNTNDLAKGSSLVGRTSATVESLIQLAALPRDRKLVAQLILGGRSGLFLFDDSNHLSDVSSDPQQGVYVAPLTDPTGASGAWIRQYGQSTISGPDVKVEWFGADPTGVLASDVAFNSAINFCRPRRLPLTVGGGFFTIEAGIDFVQAGDVSGDTMHMEFRGAGRYATILCSRGAPEYVIKIDGRYSNLSGFSVWGSIDEIRDTDNSAKIGIWCKNMRVGGLENFRVAHIVGAGLQIDKTIISNIDDGIVYRCGSSTKPAVYQTGSTQDGFQASSFTNINIEDSHGVGAFDFVSHRNSQIDHVTIEQQPYWIAELSNPTGQFVRDDALTFSGGATAFVGLASKDASALTNGNGEVVIRNLIGSITVGETVISSGGATGTIKAWTHSGVKQFRTSGQYGDFGSIYLNQNSLRTTGTDFDVAGSENEFRLIKLRDVHRGTAVLISGELNNVNVLDISQGLTNFEDQGNFASSLSVTGSRNNIWHVETLTAKGVSITGQRTSIGKLVQRNLYGQALDILGDYSGVEEIDSLMASYTDAGGLLNAPMIRLSGKSSYLNRGVASFPRNATDVIQLAGNYAYCGYVDILDVGSATYGIRTTSMGIGAKALGTKLTINNSTTIGCRMLGVDSKIEGITVNGGAISVEIAETGVVARGCVLYGYTTRSISASPSSTKDRIRIHDNTCHTPIPGALDDILVSNNVTYSHITGNNTVRGVGVNSFGTGVGNLVANNI